MEEEQAKRKREEAAAAKRKREEAAVKRMSNRLREEAAGLQYKPITEALDLPDRKVRLFAVVYQIGATVKSRGSDHTVTLRIVDQSHTTGISTIFFAKETPDLPRVKSSGDAISLHDVVITKRHDDFVVIFNKKSSSFALFESKGSAECRPYQASKAYRTSKDDKEQLTKIRTWLPPDLKGLGLKDFELYLRSLKSDSAFDLVCKVLHVHDDNDKWIFYVWDGTDTPAAEFQAILDGEAVLSPPLLEGPPQPRDVLCKMPCVGTVLRIFSETYDKAIPHMKKGIYWARFWNITCKQEFGIWKGIFSESSRVRLLANEDGSVVDRLKMYDTRNNNKVQRQPMGSLPSDRAILSHVEYEKASYLTLMESLTHPKVTHILKTLVRVVGASELYLLSTGEYCIQLTLEDPTARVNAYVCKDELVKFFDGILTVESIIKKMNKLLGIPEPEGSKEVAPLTMNPPWIWCCLVSYYLDENDPWGSRRYQVFGTRIRD